MVKTLILCLSIPLLLSCQSVLPIPSVMTETKQGETLVMTQVQETASRKDVPADVAPREVIAKVETKSGAKVYVVKKSLFKPAVVYQNEQAKKEGLTVVQPKDPWWKWPAIVGGGILGIALLLGLLKLRALWPF